jgi:sulfite reductase beta subunit-like hemoprotein
MDGMPLLRTYCARCRALWHVELGANSVLAHLCKPTMTKGYSHFTTRQNIQYSWPELGDVPDMLSNLADVGMHAIQNLWQYNPQRHGGPFRGRRARMSCRSVRPLNCCVWFHRPP